MADDRGWARGARLCVSPCPTAGRTNPAATAGNLSTPSASNPMPSLSGTHDDAADVADGGIPPGTAFDDIPSDWYCPVCGARKADFEPLED